ncbi:hypothetical protein [Amycolatopsis sp. H20-H5]|uniref:hypothetical protein n=1 Tax=Amycolatopsis sp. H20-H5 TaxID=3046309 RepID=UPI002DB7B5C9|nr:hypothetical protein [Amycolatopsis sp. H20-H5]MEC3979645.1 hypothetical protein [Amycolatopsis sp. H20-H5]
MSQFGNGEVGGDNHWTAPVHGTTADGQDVTASFGTDGRDGEALIARGHADSMGGFYGSSGQKGHDHFGPDGEPYGDRGQSD